MTLCPGCPDAQNRFVWSDQVSEPVPVFWMCVPKLLSASFCSFRRRLRQATALRAFVSCGKGFAFPLDESLYGVDPYVAER
jgi:hypothetical protein